MNPDEPKPLRGRAWRTVLVVALLIVAGALVFRFGVRDHLFPKNFGVVDEGKVYRSGKLTPGTLSDVVERHAIRTIVDLGTWPAGSAGDRREQRTADALGVERYRFELVGDGTGNPNHYVNTLRIMTDPARQPVLVHCGAGAERTGMSVMLYRQVTLGTPIEEAYAEARRYKHDPGRNPRLREVLSRYGPMILEAYREGRQISVPGEVEPVSEPAPVETAPPPAR
jgi:protein tyrosine/serine phosphatase